jgi:putative Holliday junction resolvase
MTVETGKLLAVDVGGARIGVAVCDPLQLAARPITVIQRRSRRDDFDLLAEIIENEEVVAVICGLPFNMDGSEGEQAKGTRRWAGRLAQALRAILGQPMPVIFWDERLSSYAAQQIIAGGGTQMGEDAVAAAVILQSYLDAGRNGPRDEIGQIILPPKEVQE